MRTMVARFTFTALLGLLFGLWGAQPAPAFPLAPPQETIAGLTPGVSTVADASRLFGVYDVVLTGRYSQYAGGPRASKAYRWVSGGAHGNVPGLVIETGFRSPRIEMVVVDGYPGICTSAGLMAFTAEPQVVELYGLPDYAFEISLDNQSQVFHELFYVDQGLLVVLGQISERPNFTVTKLILTYPTYLRNAIAMRERYAMDGLIVEDITASYRSWIRTVVPPA